MWRLAVKRSSIHNYVTYLGYNWIKEVEVATTDSDIIRDEQERSNLLRAISDLETAIAVSNPGTRRILENAAENAKKRITTLDHRIEEAKVERAAEVQAQVVAAAALAAKETKLNAKERETYRGFMEESYFTKKDFGKLDEFYAHSYDRLSEGGKDQMSKRIDEGIKRGEFEFNDLPKNALEKEVAHRAGRTHRKALTQEHGDTGNLSTQSTVKTAVENIDLGSVDLTGVKLAETAGSPSASTLPDSSGSRANTR